MLMFRLVSIGAALAGSLQPRPSLETAPIAAAPAREVAPPSAAAPLAGPADVAGTAPSPSVGPLSLDEVHQLLSAGLGGATLCALVDERGLAAPLPVPDILALHAKGASDETLAALVRASSKSSALNGLDVTVREGALVVSQVPDPPVLASRESPEIELVSVMESSAARRTPARPRSTPVGGFERPHRRLERANPGREAPPPPSAAPEVPAELVAQAVRAELARHAAQQAPPAPVVVQAPPLVREVPVRVPVPVPVPYPVAVREARDEPPPDAPSPDDPPRDGIRRIPIRTSRGTQWVPN